MSWIQSHGPAVVAIVGAVGAFVANVDPTVGDLLGATPLS